MADNADSWSYLPNGQTGLPVGMVLISAPIAAMTAIGLTKDAENQQLRLIWTAAIEALPKVTTGHRQDWRSVVFSSTATIDQLETAAHNLLQTCSEVLHAGLTVYIAVSAADSGLDAALTRLSTGVAQLSKTGRPSTVVLVD